MTDTLKCGACHRNMPKSKLRYTGYEEGFICTGDEVANCYDTIDRELNNAMASIPAVDDNVG